MTVVNLREHQSAGTDGSGANWRTAFLELEQGISELHNMAKIASIVDDEPDEGLGIFSSEMVLRMAEALELKYYELHRAIVPREATVPDDSPIA